MVIQREHVQSESSHSVEMVSEFSSMSTTILSSWRSVDVQSFTSEILPASPKLILEMNDVQVKSGEMATFSCSFDGQPFTCIVWDHNGNGVGETKRMRSSERGGLLSLIIQSVSLGDQGVYRCTASNTHGHNSSSARLIVEGGYSLLSVCLFISSFHWLCS